MQGLPFRHLFLAEAHTHTHMQLCRHVRIDRDVHTYTYAYVSARTYAQIFTRLLLRFPSSSLLRYTFAGTFLHSFVRVNGRLPQVKLKKNMFLCLEFLQKTIRDSSPVPSRKECHNSRLHVGITEIFSVRRPSRFPLLVRRPSKFPGFHRLGQVNLWT